MSVPERSLVTTADADADLASIALYGIQTWDREQALRYVTEISAVFDSLTRFPRLGRPVDTKVRSIPVRDHLVYYEADEQSVTILRVLHRRRDPAGDLGLS